ncbi:MAG: hypothetical protein ACOCUF_03190 [Patescibacteria group bacterium]
MKIKSKKNLNISSYKKERLLKGLFPKGEITLQELKLREEVLQKFIEANINRRRFTGLESKNAML